MYNPTVMDHFQNPRNAGEITDADGVGEVGNPNCGDVMRLYIKVEDGRILLPNKHGDDGWYGYTTNQLFDIHMGNHE